MNRTIQEIADMLRNGEETPTKVVNMALELADRHKDLNAFVEVFTKTASQDARRAEMMFKEGKETLLTGIPYAIKDNLCIEGKEVTACSSILKNHFSPYTATVVKRLQDQGAICIGRTNMDEFAMGSSTETSNRGVTKNPKDMTRVPGGSSGGSAVAVAAGVVPFALGSDTGGSVRQPASFCGCVGFKPTYASISRHGLITLASSLDVIGIFANTLACTEVVFNVIRGEDGYDATVSANNVTKSVDTDQRFIIGIPSFVEKSSISTQNHFERMIKYLESKGWSTVSLSMPIAQEALTAYYIIQPAEASGNLARFDGVRFGQQVVGDTAGETIQKSRNKGLGEEVSRRIAIGAFVLSTGYRDAYYERATNLRHALRAEFVECFKKVSLIATPTTVDVAFAIGEIQDPVQMYTQDLFTVPVSLAGNPAISVPMCEKPLPLGIQYIAPINKDNWLLETVAQFEYIKI